MSAFMIVTITVKNPEKLQQYIAKVQKVSAQYGAELLHRGKIGRALSGHDKDHDLAVVVRFPSIEKIDAWYDSEEYQPLIALREEGADMKITSYEVLP